MTLPGMAAVRRRSGLVVGGLASAFLLTACFPPSPPLAGGPPPPPPPGACSGAAVTATLGSQSAGSQAAAAYRDSDERTNVPLVTVEQTADGQRITTHAVDSSSEASTVASEVARRGHLVAVAVAEPIRAQTNDVLFSQQWGMSATTFTNAWSTTTGTGVTVAVVDSGVAASHPDLTGRVVTGEEFLGNSGIGVAGGTSDPNGHGTHVAGIVAATANNGLGVTGGAPGARILPVRVLDASGSGWDSDVARGIDWAADHCARVVNLSLGGGSSSVVVDAAVAYARSKGAVVVAAAGNTGAAGNTAVYPGASPGVIAVAAVDAALARANFSTSGSYVAIAAPGVSVLSTYSPSTYVFMSGTSMATPFVSAAAALVLAAHPSCTPDGVAARLEQSAQHLGAPVPNNDLGYGLVDPAAAIAVAGCA